MCISKEIIDSYFKVDLETGVITRKIIPGVRNFEKPVEGIDKDGYINFLFKGKRYRAHRFIWFYATGSFPTKDIDHIDGNKTHNAIRNLREATTFQNMQNLRKPLSNNKSGFLGVYLCKASKKYYSQIKAGTIRKHLGYFNTPEEAYNAYIIEKRKLHPYCTI